MVKRIAIILFVLLILGGGGGAAYWFLLKSPIPDMDDVRRDDYEKFVEVAKTALKDGVKFHHAIAVGDDVTPSIYVASNLPENTVINISLSGIPGTLVNALEAEAKFNAPIMKTKLATFGPLKVDGKPLPMGDYKMAIYTDGGERIDLSIFLGGKKGPIYERRMAQYKEKLQAIYDPEVLELRELVQTTHAVFDEFSKKITEIRTMMPTIPAKKANAIASWKQYGINLDKFIGGMDQKIKEKLAAAQAAGQEKFYPYVYKDIQSLLAQILQVYAQQSAATESGTPVPPSTPDPFQQMQLMLQGFDKVMAEAPTRSPLDALLLKLQVAKATPAAAAPVASPVPANPVGGSPVVPATPPPVK